MEERPMPKQDVTPELVPVRPLTLPPDFPDIPQNPSSEPPPDFSARAYQVAGTTTYQDRLERLRRQNARLRDTIHQVLEKHPELREVTEDIALRQDLRVQADTPFLERIQGKLQERARAIIERRPDLEHLFDKT
jgi:hypothetical protein